MGVAAGFKHCLPQRPTFGGGLSEGARYDANLSVEVLMTADYNGWNDQPEEEREALDQLELSTTLSIKGDRYQPRREPRAGMNASSS
jgi:hypothetical protein